MMSESMDEYTVKNLGIEMEAASEGCGGVQNMIEEGCGKEKAVDKTCEEEIGEKKPMDMKAKLDELEQRVVLLESLVTAGGSKSGSRVISRKEMAKWVVKAIKEGDSFLGVSKCYIRKYLCEYFSMPQNSYYFRKLNNILSVGVEEKSLHYDRMHQLYKIA